MKFNIEKQQKQQEVALDTPQKSSIEKKEGMYYVPLGDATVIDNESILSVKQHNFAEDQNKLASVLLERSQYEGAVNDLLASYPDLEPLYENLTDIHHKLWYIEDRKRAIEEGLPIDQVLEKLMKPENAELLKEYLTLSREVSLYNDQRAKIKREMNQITGSKIVEVKSHKQA